MFTRLLLGSVLGMTLLAFAPGANAQSKGDGLRFGGADNNNALFTPAKDNENSGDENKHKGLKKGEHGQKHDHGKVSER